MRMRSSILCAITLSFSCVYTVALSHGNPSTPPLVGYAPGAHFPGTRRNDVPVWHEAAPVLLPNLRRCVTRVCHWRRPLEERLDDAFIPELSTRRFPRDDQHIPRAQLRGLVADRIVLDLQHHGLSLRRGVRVQSLRQMRKRAPDSALGLRPEE